MRDVGPNYEVAEQPAIQNIQSALLQSDLESEYLSATSLQPLIDQLCPLWKSLRISATEASFVQSVIQQYPRCFGEYL